MININILVPEAPSTRQRANMEVKLFSHFFRHAEIIDGKKIAKEVQAEVAEEVEAWVKAGHRPPHLTAVLVGEDPASAVYVRNKMKAAQACGKKTSPALMVLETSKVFLFCYSDEFLKD